MKKCILLTYTLFVALVGIAQYNNEWIDYNKTYFRFPVSQDGFYRIPQATIQAAGLGNTPAEQFQLWRNGVQVPIFTSNATGALGASGYIEFWGEMNDGKPDTPLYSDPNNQLSNKWSLHSDTASYFLTANPAGGNFRYTNEANGVAGTSLTPEVYFMYTFSKHFNNRFNHGDARIVDGQLVHSSAYDKGEGYATGEIRATGTTVTENLGNLFAHNGGLQASIYAAGFGNGFNTRTVHFRLNNQPILDAETELFNHFKKTEAFSTTILGTTNQLQITNTSTQPNDRAVVSNYQITYPRLFNFGAAVNFPFDLPESATPKFLRITNFTIAGVAPILYDITNRKRYVCDISESGVVKVVLQPSAQKRNLVLISQRPNNIHAVNQLQSRNFVNYANTDFQGDYVIISNNRLYGGSNGNQVEAYRQYRSSAAGGSFNAKVYDIDQLRDQFAFGIHVHPHAVKNFIRYALNYFAIQPKYTLIIGRGLTYTQARTGSKEHLEQINLVPTFGFPASDNQLAVFDNSNVPQLPIGRISAISGQEVEIYLNKVKEHENWLKNAPLTTTDKGWYKNIVHALGGRTVNTGSTIASHMAALKATIQDTAFGAQVYDFTQMANLGSDLNSEELKRKFSEGIGYINYFGHSSSSTLEFNIDDPYVYENEGKYPFFLVNGCYAGDIFVNESSRPINLNTLSEKYVLAKQRGSIGFIASTHYGIVNYLNTYLQGMYQSLSSGKAGLTIGESLVEAFQFMQQRFGADFYAKLHLEQILLHGDPAIRAYPLDKPDYVIEERNILLPDIVSVTDSRIDVTIIAANIGLAVNDSITLSVKRVLANGTELLLLRKRIPGIRYTDTTRLSLNINPALEAGQNRLVVTIDEDDDVDEVSESNNTVSKSFFIIDDGAKPVYPYEYAIVNTQLSTFFASTADPVAPRRNYVMEIDTTANFNSTLKRTVSVNGAEAGLVEFSNTLTFTDSTVYYWRVGLADEQNKVWNNSSFIYLQSASPGYNQSNYFQFKNNRFSGTELHEDRKFRFEQSRKILSIRTGLHPTHINDALSVSIDETRYDTYGCALHSLQIKVYDPITMIPWSNYTEGSTGRFGSVNPCAHNEYTFEYRYTTPTGRKAALDLLNSIPNGYFVSIANYGSNATAPAGLVDEWKKDTATLGSGTSLYHKFVEIGFARIDSFTRPLPFLHFFKVGDLGYPSVTRIGETVTTHIVENIGISSTAKSGYFESPLFGPALEWDKLLWNGIKDPDEDITIGIYGKKNINDPESLIATVVTAKDTSIAAIDAKQYPFLRLRASLEDTVNATPAQLNYWRLTGKLPPEGAIASNLYYVGVSDTTEAGETANFGIAFKNITPEPFDSVKVYFTITDRNNVQHIIDSSRKKPIAFNDTIKLNYTINTNDYPGQNTLGIRFNPEYDQPEQSLLNNFIFKGLYVRVDETNPLLDVTFDGTYILNDDIVSSKPHIVIKLKDENQVRALDDTSLLRIQVRFPDRTIRSFNFNNDTLRFTPSSLNKGDNTAMVDFNPEFLEDGNYELIVSGRDKSGNPAGSREFRVAFKVINKPMISNMFNYPNPFTSSTAFVFTLTGSEVPQNLRIQILTITGKIVKEITKHELGDIRIGRNITDYKWDGTDQYGQKLANGVYLYRVITNLNGQSLDKYKAEGDRTDQYFNKGYGKMYLMR